MLKEVKNTYQKPDEPFHRCFSSSNLDLIVWYSKERRITGFQLSYRNGPEEKALTWQETSGFTHKSVDDGEGRVLRPKMTPILIPDGIFYGDHVLDLFRKESTNIEGDLGEFVCARIQEYSGSISH